MSQTSRDIFLYFAILWNIMYLCFVGWRLLRYSARVKVPYPVVVMMATPVSFGIGILTGEIYISNLGGGQTGVEILFLVGSIRHVMVYFVRQAPVESSEC